MPIDYFGDESVKETEIGVVTRTSEIYHILCQSLGIPQSDIPVWKNVDEAIVLRRAQSLGIGASSAEKALALIEERYKTQVSEAFDVPIDSPDIWGEASQIYNEWKSTLSTQERLVENLRFATARSLQLNKFMATWEEINEELESLRLTKYQN